MFKLIVTKVNNGILLLSGVGSNEQNLLEYGINFTSGNGYRSYEVEIRISNLEVKSQMDVRDIR